MVRASVCLVIAATLIACGGTDDAAKSEAPLVFAAMGDVPYGLVDEVTLRDQIDELNRTTDVDFVVHVGDIKPGSGACVELAYEKVANSLSKIEAPTFVLPGDNEWNDCANVDEGWSFWQKHLARFNERWDDTPEVDRQDRRNENFAWRAKRILLIGLALPAGLVWDQTAWDAMLDDAAAWTEQQFHDHADTEAAVVFTHAGPGEEHVPYFDRFQAAAEAFAKPVLLLHGNGHSWIRDRPWGGTLMERIQVAKGGDEPPVILTVRPDGAEPFQANR